MSEIIGVVNYGMGNINSVVNKLTRLGFMSEVINESSQLSKCSKIILPGVGHFAKAINELQKRKLWDSLNAAVIQNKKPILGICLGMQLMASHSEEGCQKGFGWFNAEVIKFRIDNKLKYKVPHMGWNRVSIEKDSRIFEGVDLTHGFYFVHAYHFLCNESNDILNTTIYEYPFVSAVQKDNIYGVQYHPEKSHEAGEKLLSNFINL